MLGAQELSGNYSLHLFYCRFYYHMSLEGLDHSVWGPAASNAPPHTHKCQGFFLRVGIFLGKAAQALISGGLEACAPLG